MNVVACSPRVSEMWNVFNTIIKPLHLLKEGESLKIEIDEQSLNYCQYMARVASCEGFKFIVIDHKTCFEIARVPLFIDADRQEKVAKNLKYTEFQIEDIVGKLRTELAVYKKLTFSEVSKTLTGGNAFKMKSDHLITKTYLMRRVSANSMFKRHPDGVKVALQSGLQVLIDNNELEVVEASTMDLEYNTSATAYKIL